MTCLITVIPIYTTMQKRLFRYWIFLWLVAGVFFLYPINNLFLRIGLLGSLLAVWTGCLFFGFRWKFFRIVFLLLTVSIIGFFFCPGRKYEEEKLRETYVHALQSYEGTRYIWGGENKLGIDCSGLVRAGLIKANFRNGLLTLNPRLLRYALYLWWHDSSAEALGNEYGQQTKHLLAQVSLNDLGQNTILPGDMAVTISGVHIMAFLGDSKWIEADPNLKKVVIVQVPEGNNPWFQESFNIVRWQELASE